MSFHGTNTFIPFPRYENAVFIGDTAAETLAELKIYARGLIGGELPNMQSYHPAEKLLECTSCVMNDQRLLTPQCEEEKLITFFWKIIRSPI